MAKTSISLLALLAALGSSQFALAGDTSDMVQQLLPSEPQSTLTANEKTVLTVQSATKAEMIGRLGSDMLSRSLNSKAAPPAALVLSEGHETDTLAALKRLPSMQVAVSFQGSSDALAPEAGALLGTLGDALNDPKLASYKFIVGVHTNSVGSDEYNLSLSRLRAKAIVDALVAAHSLGKDRLYAVGFGRLTDGTDASGLPAERIRVVNLANTPVVTDGGPVSSVPGPVAVGPKRVRNAVSTTKSAPRAPRVVIHRERVVQPHGLAQTRPRHGHTVIADTVTPPPHGRHHATRWTSSGVVRARYPSDYGVDPDSDESGQIFVGSRATGRYSEGSDGTSTRASFNGGRGGGSSSGGSSGGSASGGNSSNGGSSSGGSSSGSSSSGNSSSGSSSSGSSSSGSSSSGGSSSGSSNSGSSSSGSSSSGSSNSGSSSSGSSNTGGNPGGGGGGGGSTGGGGWKSDRRLKRNIKRLATSKSGLGIYSFDYIWGGPTFVGVMAQEVVVSHPDAVLIGHGGFLEVDYSQIDVAMMTLAQWKSQRSAAILEA